METLPTLLSALAPLAIGGLIPTIGAHFFVRSARGSERLARMSGAVVGLVCALFVAGGLAAGWGLVQRILGAADASTALPGTPLLVAAGLAIGLPLTIPPLLSGWLTARARSTARQKRVLAPATREERRSYAEDLERQIREVSVPPRDVTVTAGGDGNRVLIIEGEMSAKEGERLTAALREDLGDVGFKRVERAGPGRSWWTKV